MTMQFQQNGTSDHFANPSMLNILMAILIDSRDNDDEEETGAEVSENPAAGASAFCTGCPSEIDPESETVQELTAFALNALEGAANSGNVQAVVRVVKATSQVCDWTFFFLIFILD